MNSAEVWMEEELTECGTFINSLHHDHQRDEGDGVSLSLGRLDRWIVQINVAGKKKKILEYVCLPFPNLYYRK